jgi:hypothetical protein
VLEGMIAEAVQIPVTVETMIAEAVPLSDEESQRPVVPPPLDTTVVRRQQKEAIAKVIRRYAIYLLLLIVIVLAAGVVGGVCGTGKCSSSGSSTGATPAAAHESPNSTDAPTTKVPTEAVLTLKPISDRAAAIAAYINNITLLPSSITISYPPVNETGSVTVAEELALQWLVESDPLNLTVASSDQFRLQQRYALAAFWFETTHNGHVWTTNTGWLTANNECNWLGIYCTDVVGLGGAGEVQSVVEGISLPENNIHGGIPVDLGLLPNLKTIDLSYNSFAGSLPKSIDQWSNLKYFDISISYDLVSVDLAGGFTGTLPESIGEWSALQKFNTFGNAMTGTLPTFIGQWSNLTYFGIDYNSHTGTLPDSIGNWSKLEIFGVHNNALTGTIPKSIENWSSVIYARFDFNNFTGSMPTGICKAINATLGDVLWADCSLTCTCCTGCG